MIYLREIRPSEGMTYTEARDILVAEYKAEADERRFIEQADRLVDIIYEDPTTLDCCGRRTGPGSPGSRTVRTRRARIRYAPTREVVNAAFSDLVLGAGRGQRSGRPGDNHIVLIR